MPISSCPKTCLVSDTKRTTSPPVVSTGDPTAVFTSAYVLPKSAIAPMEVDGRVSSASTDVVVATEENVTQAPIPSTSPSETTQFVLNKAVSTESTLQDIPSSDTGIISNVDSAQVNGFFSYFLFVFSVFSPYKGKQVLFIVL